MRNLSPPPGIHYTSGAPTFIGAVLQKVISMKLVRRSYTSQPSSQLSQIVTAVMFILAAAANMSTTPSAAQDASASAFHGHWQGSGFSESEVSINFHMTARDLDVVITPTGEGFSIAWTTVQRQKGDPNKPSVVRKGSEIVFQSSSQDGVWHEARGKGFKIGDRYAWSRIEENTMITQIIVVDDEGRSDLHVYRRTLSGSGMTLEFRRLVDGELVRTVDGKLIKIAN